jgi:hypothetical protein
MPRQNLKDILDSKKFPIPNNFVMTNCIRKAWKAIKANPNTININTTIQNSNRGNLIFSFFTILPNFHNYENYKIMVGPIYYTFKILST